MGFTRSLRPETWSCQLLAHLKGSESRLLQQSQRRQRSASLPVLSRLKESTSDSHRRHGEEGRSNDASLKPRTKLRVHPSKQREKARQTQHDKKLKRWEASGNASTASGEWAEEFFDEKWTHKQGRLSDWNPPFKSDKERSLDEIDGPDSSHRTSERHTRHHNAELRGSRRPGRALLERFRQKRPQEQQQQSAPAEQPLERQETAAETPQHTVEHKDDGSWRFFATCHPGLEQAVATELRGPAIGAHNVQPGQAGVSFW